MLRDIYNRPLKDLRISVTDRCNFRCTYCMPFDEYEWIDKKEILEKINGRYPLKEIGRDKGSAASVDYEFIDGGGDLGVIASVTEPFCSTCTRARLTADGKLVTCLFSATGHDLKNLLRNGATDEEIIDIVSAIWGKRTDRYSDERLEAMNSGRGYRAKDHRKIEMISLGG